MRLVETSGSRWGAQARSPYGLRTIQSSENRRSAVVTLRRDAAFGKPFNMCTGRESNPSKWHFLRWRCRSSLVARVRESHHFRVKRESS